MSMKMLGAELQKKRLGRNTTYLVEGKQTLKIKFAVTNSKV